MKRIYCDFCGIEIKECLTDSGGKVSKIIFIKTKIRGSDSKSREQHIDCCPVCGMKVEQHILDLTLRANGQPTEAFKNLFSVKKVTLSIKDKEAIKEGMKFIH